MFLVGKLISTHGVHGRLVLAHTLADSSWLRKDMVLYLELSPGSYIPYFIEEFSAWDDTRYGLLLEGVDTLEEARKLQGVSVWVEEEWAPAAKDDPSSWVGFRLVDRQLGGLGVVDAVIRMGPQWIAQLFCEGKEILVPLADDLILEVNQRNQYLRMDLPDGLVDLYLENGRDARKKKPKGRFPH